MQRPKTFPAFSETQRGVAHVLLASKVAFMMGRKLEEGDWASVYCQAKGIPERGWSNLKIDVMYQGLGVEHKMLRVRSDSPMKSFCGTSQMHPSATRAIRIRSTDADPNEVMADVLKQYGELLAERRRKIKQDCPEREPDLRTGWLLWQSNLTEFLYFEEEALAPDPKGYFAEWKDSGGGSRKPSKNLWIYERESGRKRYSVTTAAGVKIQPYFDVPPPNDPNVYIFKVQGEEIAPGMIRIWISSSTARELKGLVGDLSPERLGVIIETIATEQNGEEDQGVTIREQAVPLTLTSESYKLLVATFPAAVSDEHMAQMLVTRLPKVIH